jgi:hypothetical protein
VFAPRARECVYDLVFRHPARQGGYVGVFKGPFGPKGNIYGLSPMGRDGAAVVAFLGDVNDPEPDFGLRLAVSRAAHRGIFAFVIT